ncbi:HD domain-containing protein [Streptomyces aidingensis]|uniref:wHTH domain-containing protein n=1 Tax=Streptomyces aidingensis TaxID=910347 RepID=UPI001587ED23|nr:caspase family protein [Streptomyces aidingensis]
MTATRYRALLLGVGEYQDKAFDPLPFVQDELAALADALKGRGYEVENPAVPDVRPGRTRVKVQIQEFLTTARTGDRLFLYLSGHGLHIDGSDYLVPADADTGLHPLTDSLVEIGWRRELDQCEAAGVLVAVDACREGVHLNALNTSWYSGWTRNQRALAERRQVAYLFACSPGQLAYYVRGGEGNEPFSVFTRALCELVRDPAAPASLADARTALQDRMNRLRRLHRTPPQKVVLLGEHDDREFLMLPGGTTAARDAHGAPAHPWVRVAREHQAWALAAGRRGLEVTRDATVRMVGRLAELRDGPAAATAGNPWYDGALAERTADRLQFLLTPRLSDVAPDPGGPGIELSPAEASLLVLSPFLDHLLGLRRLAAELPPGPAADWLSPPGSARGGVQAGEDPLTPGFRRYVRGNPRLTRRAVWARTGGDIEGAAAIGWWACAHWADRTLSAVLGDEAGKLLHEVSDAAEHAGSALLRQTLDPGRIARLLRATREGTRFLTGDGLAARATVAPGTRDEQEVREKLLAVLLSLSSLLAIDPARLGDVVVDHLGIADSVDIPGLHRTLAAAAWSPRGTTSRVLHAACGHPAVYLALQEQADRVGALLGAVQEAVAQEPALAPLAGLPSRAAADGVEMSDAESRRIYGATGVHFRLADDRVQELLMGEQLYGDRALALRELYQNALDACRYRRARTEYLRRTGGAPPGTEPGAEPRWEGRIAFRQGVDERGRAYIECADNGIGMGVREIRDLFARAGSRFADFPEFLEEQAGWAALDPPVVLHPNSQFGIGVLSYFMLADEIEVTTCRLGRDGTPGDLLRVSIAGPGALFRITPLGTGPDAGTTVRLYLSPLVAALSCTDVLRRLLWVAEFPTTAQHGDDSVTWEPGRLSEAAPVGSEDPMAPDARRSGNWLVAVGTGREPIGVWWCDGPGGLLADGLWAGTPRFGTVVNLTGPEAPALSVDRRSVVRHDRARTEAALRDAVGALCAAPDGPPGYDWLRRVAAEAPALADEILRSLAADPARCWDLGPDNRRRIAVFGHFGEDFENPPADWRDHYSFFSLPAAVRYLAGGGRYGRPAGVWEWRLGAYLAAAPDDTGADAAEVPADQVTALPGDAALLELVEDPPSPVSRGALIALAVRTGRDPAALARRFRELGYETADDSALPADLTENDLISVRLMADESAPWLPDDRPVPQRHLTTVAARLRRPVAEVAGRLAALGYQVPGADPPDGGAAPAESGRRPGRKKARLFSRKGTAVPAPPAGPVLRGSPPRPAAPRADPYVYQDVTGSGNEPLTTRVQALGFRLPDLSLLPGRAQGDGAAASGEAVPRAVTRPQLLLLAQLANRTPWEMARHLAARGVAVPKAPEAPEAPEAGEEHKDLLLLDTLGTGPRLPGTTLGLGPLMALAARLRMPLDEVTGRLRALGLRTADTEGLPFDPAADRALIGDWNSVDGDWLRGSSAGPVALLRAARRTYMSPLEAARRLAELGFAVPRTDRLPDQLRPEDLRMVSADLDGRGPWLAEDRPVPAVHVLRAAVFFGEPVSALRGRLTGLGFEVPEQLVPARPGPGPGC